MPRFFSRILFTLFFFFLLIPISQATIQISSVSCICETGSQASIVLEADGTAGPFTFAWAGPLDYTSNEQSPNDLTVPGMYTVTVTNSFGCDVVESVEVSACPPIIYIDFSKCLVVCMMDSLQ